MGANLRFSTALLDHRKKTLAVRNAALKSARHRHICVDTGG
jgi:hypothetical protein